MPGRLTERILERAAEAELRAGCGATTGAAPSSVSFCLQGAAAAVVKAVHRALGLFQRGGDFHRREAGDVPEDQHLALIFGQLLEGDGEDRGRAPGRSGPGRYR